MDPDILFSLLRDSLDLFAQSRHAKSSSQKNEKTAGTPGHLHSLTDDKHSGTEWT